MAYPFAPLPSLDDFIDRVTSTAYGSKINTTDVSGPRGRIKIEVLTRKIGNGKQRIAVIPDLKGSDILTPHVLRSLCVQLDIPPKDFGLDLD